jgi:ribosome-binding factor A
MFTVKGTPTSTDASLALHVHEVKLNRDCSHAYVSWTFPLLEQFSKEAHAEFGAESAGRFVQRAVSHVNGKLQRREAQFRSYIIKHMSFRRVPRLYFSPWNVQLGVNFGAVVKGRAEEGTRVGEDLQAVLRRNPKPPLHKEPTTRPSSK